jgi:hypothetical protein
MLSVALTSVGFENKSSRMDASEIVQAGRCCLRLSGANKTEVTVSERRAPISVELMSLWTFACAATHVTIDPFKKAVSACEESTRLIEDQACGARTSREAHLLLIVPFAQGRTAVFNSQQDKRLSRRTFEPNVFGAVNRVLRTLYDCRDSC